MDNDAQVPSAKFTSHDKASPIDNSRNIVLAGGDGEFLYKTVELKEVTLGDVIIKSSAANLQQIGSQSKMFPKRKSREFLKNSQHSL
jgi:hypothetical protein